MSTKRTSRFGSNVIDNVEKRKRESSGFGYLNLTKGLSAFKEEEGKIKMDIIPYIVSDTHHLDRNVDDQYAANPGNPWYKKPVWVHRGIGADKQSVICPAKTIGKKCPICEYRDKQKAQGLEKEEMVSYPQLRNIYVVVPVGSKKYEEKMHIWDIANGNFQKILDEELGEKPENGSFPDPEEGKTLVVRFTEEKFGKNKYFEASRVDFEEREAYDESVMDKAPKLDDMVKILTYKELEVMFLELNDDDVVDKPKKKVEAEDDVSSLRKKRVVESEEDDSPRGKGLKKKVEEEDDDDDVPFETTRLKKTIKKEVEAEDEDDDDDEEVKPRRRPEAEAEPVRKKTIKKEDEDDDDDDVEEKPLRKRTVVKKEVEAEDDDEEDAEPLKKKEEPLSREESKKKKGYECPSDHVFGADWGDFDDCDGCPLFNTCGKEKEKLRKK